MEQRGRLFFLGDTWAGNGMHVAAVRVGNEWGQAACVERGRHCRWGFQRKACNWGVQGTRNRDVAGACRQALIVGQWMWYVCALCSSVMGYPLSRRKIARSLKAQRRLQGPGGAAALGGSILVAGQQEPSSALCRVRYISRSTRRGAWAAGPAPCY